MNSHEIVKKHKKAPARAFNMSLINNNDVDSLKQHDFQQSVLTMQKSVTITSQRSNSLDYLNFEEKRQLIASSLSLSDILSNQVGPVVAQAAKDVAAASSVIGKLKLKGKVLLARLRIRSNHSCLARNNLRVTSFFSFLVEFTYKCHFCLIHRKIFSKLFYLQWKDTMEPRFEQPASIPAQELLHSNEKANLVHLEDFSSHGNGDEKRKAKSSKLRQNVSIFLHSFIRSSFTSANLNSNRHNIHSHHHSVCVFHLRRTAFLSCGRERKHCESFIPFHSSLVVLEKGEQLKFLSF